MPGAPAVPVEPPTPPGGGMSPLAQRNVVTLDPSSDAVSEPPDTVTLPSLAMLLLEEVVYLSQEETVAPLMEALSDAAPPVFTATRTTSEVPRNAESDTPDAGPLVASTR